MHTLHDRVEIPAAVVDATRLLVDASLHDTPLDTQINAGNAWLATVAAALGTAPVTYTHDDTLTYAAYDPADKQIRFSRYMNYDLIHCFRHHQQHQGIEMLTPSPADRLSGLPRHEFDAHAWACTVYFQANSERFLGLAHAHRIPGLPAYFYTDHNPTDPVQ